MKFQLHRTYPKEGYTIGDFFVDNEDGIAPVWLFNILEDKVRPIEEKVFGETAIPAGDYKMIVDYSPKFKKNIPHILNVPGFDGIRIHPGNDAEDTEGCLLPGINDEPGKVHQSTKCFMKLMTLLLNSGQQEWDIQIN
jgi:Family of unknown function (DUF5675)